MNLTDLIEIEPKTGDIHVKGPKAYSLLSVIPLISFITISLHYSSSAIIWCLIAASLAFGVVFLFQVIAIVFIIAVRNSRQLEGEINCVKC